MWRTFKTVVMVVALGAQVIVAPVATTAVEPTANQQGPNTLVFGMSTGLVYDSNVMNSQPPVSDVQYTLYPMAALRLDRPKWNTTISMTPGFSYSSANLPEYQALSLTANARLQVHPTGKLSLDFTNFLVSSLNPDGYPVDSPSPNMLCFRYEFDTGLDNSVVCDRFDGHGLLC